MPTYEYRCNECGYTWERLLKISQKDGPLSEPCPECAKESSIEQFISEAPGLGDPVRLGIRKPSQGFKEVLQKINEKTAGSKLKSGSNILSV